MKRFTKFVVESIKEADLDEAVEVRHDRYLRSHGKKAHDTFGGGGTWAFTHKDRGDVDYNNDKEVYKHSGKFADAKKAAQQWGKKHGHSTVYVMEEVDSVEEGKWDYPKDITGSKPSVYWDLGNKKKKEARKTHRQKVKAKAHSDLMKGQKKTNEEVELDEDMNALTTAAAMAPAAALAASGLLYKGYGKSKRSVMDRIADTKDAKRRHKDSIKQADKYLSKSTNPKTLDKYKKQKDDSQNKLKQSSYLKSLSRNEEFELDEQAMTFQNAEKLKNKHLAAMDHHKKSGNSKGYAAHSMVVRKFEDAYDRHGTGVIPSGRIVAASQKAFKDYPHSGMKESVELDEARSWFDPSDHEQFKNMTPEQKKARHDSLMKLATTHKNYDIRSFAKSAANELKSKHMKEEVELDEAEYTHHAARVGTTTWGVGKTPDEARKDAHKAIHKHYSSSAPSRNDKEIDRHMARAEKTKGALKIHPTTEKTYRKYVTEEVELDEVSDKKLDAYRQKAFADQPSGDDGSDKYRKRKFGRDLAFSKQTGRAKVLATKEEVEQIDEISKKTLVNYMDKSKKQAADIQKKFKKGTETKDDEKTFDRRVSGQIKALDKFHGRAKVPASGTDKAYDYAQKALKKEEVELDEASAKMEIPKSRYLTISKMHDASGPTHGKVTRSPKGTMQYKGARHLDHDKKTDTHIVQTYSHGDHGLATIEKHTHNPSGEVKYYMYKKTTNEEVELDEGIVKSYSSLSKKPWSEVVKGSKDTAGERKQIAKGKDFTVWTTYGGSLKRQAHYVVRDDNIIGSGWTMNAALKDAGLKDSDLIARSKFVQGSILNKGMKEEVELDEINKKETDKFHRDLDKLVHKTFGHSSDEKKEKMKEAVNESVNDMVRIGQKMLELAPKEKNDMISNAYSRLGDALTRYGTPFGPKNVADLEKKTGMNQRIIMSLIKKVQQ